MSVNSQRALFGVRDWNEKFPIGTVVILDGTETVTESHAGMGPGRDCEPCVFVAAVQEPVPLRRLTVPGWEMVKEKAMNKCFRRQHTAIRHRKRRSRKPSPP